MIEMETHHSAATLWRDAKIMAKKKIDINDKDESVQVDKDMPCCALFVPVELCDYGRPRAPLPKTLRRYFLTCKSYLSNCHLFRLRLFPSICQPGSHFTRRYLQSTRRLLNDRLFHLPGTLSRGPLLFVSHRSKSLLSSL